MGDRSEQQVKRRRVFYIPGYDPIHPRRYRELYRGEGTAQAAISGYDISLSPKGKSDLYGWHVNGRIDGADVQADVDVLVWSDIVRDSMSNTIPATYLQLVRTAWVYITSGALWRLMKLRKGPVIAALYPVGFLLLQLALAIFLAQLVVGLLFFALSPISKSVLEAISVSLSGVVSLSDVTFFSLLGLAWFLGVVLMLAMVCIITWLILRWFRARDNKFFAYYLMHDYAYSAHHRGANPPELETRMAEFGDTIAAALKDDVDEVLVVGHSSGAHLAVSILADLIRAGRVPSDGPALAFLSLGQVVPMVSFLPDASRLRGDLRDLSARDEITWVDITAPGDGCAFALCDPVAVTGVAPDDKRWPLVVSAAFTQTLSPDRWKELRWRFFRLHFQYLCAFDRPGDYDYFQITAGPRLLADRYRGRAPSKSRLETAVSKYTSVTPP